MKINCLNCKYIQDIKQTTLLNGDKVLIGYCTKLEASGNVTVRHSCEHHTEITTRERNIKIHL